MISSTKKNPEQAQATNRILAGIAIQGDVQTDGDIRVDGSVTGNMKVSGKLVIGQQGIIDGEVECKNASIAGTLRGTLKVAQSMSLSASADIQGNVQTEKLSVEPGASINGAVTMGTVMKKVGVNENESSKTA